MSFKRFAPEDLVVSSEVVTAPLWSGNNLTLINYYSSSAQVAGETGDFYIDVYHTASADSSAEVQFAIAYCDKVGSGSNPYNGSVAGYTPSRTNYGQYRNLILGTEEEDFSFGGVSSDYFYVIAVDRARFKESLLPGTLNLVIGDSLYLTDNSRDTSTVSYNDAGRVYQVVSGSNGAAYSGTGYTTNSGSYGLFLPDVGLIVLNGKALDLTNAEGISLNTNRASSVTNNYGNAEKLFNSLESGSYFRLNSSETISSQYAFVHPRNAEFNYSTNPSYLTGSGDLRHDVMVDAPEVYITTIGFYNDSNELLAVAKLSAPLKKNFTKEALIRAKLDF